jgi:hypothetical protein
MHIILSCMFLLTSNYYVSEDYKNIDSTRSGTFYFPMEYSSNNILQWISDEYSISNEDILFNSINRLRNKYRLICIRAFFPTFILSSENDTLKLKIANKPVKDTSYFATEKLNNVEKEFWSAWENYSTSKSEKERNKIVSRYPQILDKYFRKKIYEKGLVADTTPYKYNNEISSINSDEKKAFSDWFKNSNFWEMSSINGEMNVMDGVYWLFEVFQNGKYHFVLWANPEKDIIERFFNQFLRNYKISERP